ncbi:MAG TPA: hypothetical protein EYO58_12010 [Flavobacteriales bacterium]|nr:hypothetical protein [Flavobacteriales bacterium]
MKRNLFLALAVACMSFGANLISTENDSNSSNEVILVFNPTEHFITLKFANPNYQKHQLSIFNNHGKKLKVFKNVQNDFVKIDKKLIKDCTCSYLLKKENGKYFVGKLNL